MTVDKRYIRKALTELAASSNHEMGSYDLAKNLGLCLGADCKIDQVALDKFVSHIRFLNDEHMIECGARDLGFSKTLNGMSIYKTRYRITSKGLTKLEENNSRSLIGAASNWCLGLLHEIVRKHLITLLSIGILGGLGWAFKGNAFLDSLFVNWGGK